MTGVQTCALPIFRRFPGGFGQDDAGFYHYTLGKLGASHAAIDPKKNGRCLCEIFGAYGWQLGVRTEKYLIDHFLARGINRFVPHAFSPKDFPDPDCPPHFYAHGENPQYRAFGYLMAYTNRVCHLIDGGKQKPIVALLYHGESQWAGEYQSNILACRELTRHQIDFVIIPADVLEQPERYNTDFDGKILRVNGLEIQALVVSFGRHLYRSVAEFAIRASDQGFPVIFTEQLPRDISNADCRQSDDLIGRLSNCRTIPLNMLIQTLNSLIRRDIVFKKPFANMTVFHYRNDSDVYLLLNEDPVQAFSGEIVLKGNGQAVCYDAWENVLRPVEIIPSEKDTHLVMTIDPLELKIIVIGARSIGSVVAMPIASDDMILLDDFDVSRATTKEYPDFHDPKPLSKLTSMAGLFPDFSGWFCYETTTILQAGNAALLEIDDAYESAEVFINGISAGMKTAKPYRYDIRKLVRDGENSIRIEVATTLERRAHAIGADLWSLGVKSPLSPTGLVGKVRVYNCRTA